MPAAAHSDHHAGDAPQPQRALEPIIPADMADYLIAKVPA
jgi:hypothetical protein